MFIAPRNLRCVLQRGGTVAIMKESQRYKLMQNYKKKSLWTFLSPVHSDRFCTQYLRFVSLNGNYCQRTIFWHSIPYFLEFTKLGCKTCHRSFNRGPVVRTSPFIASQGCVYRKLRNIKWMYFFYLITVKAVFSQRIRTFLYIIQLFKRQKWHLRQTCKSNECFRRTPDDWVARRKV